jgi:hypothetical protein
VAALWDLTISGLLPTFFGDSSVLLFLFSNQNEFVIK